jgi:hypothetical protein
LKDDQNRNKKILGDFGEFLCLVKFSSFNILNKDFLSIVLREHFARQIFWLKKGIDEKPEQRKYINDAKKNRFLDFWFENNTVSNNLLIFNIEAGKIFISDENII